MQPSEVCTARLTANEGSRFKVRRGSNIEGKSRVHFVEVALHYVNNTEQHYMLFPSRRNFFGVTIGARNEMNKEIQRGNEI